MNVRLHDLRHTSASLMLAAGVPVGDLSDRLGHATAGFRLTVYRHAIPGAQEKASAKLTALLDGADPNQKTPVELAEVAPKLAPAQKLAAIS